MPRKCSICKKTWNKEYVSLFQAPVCDKKRKMWIASCGVELDISAVVCEKHFTRSNFITAPGDHKRPRLLPSAKPLRDITGWTRAQQVVQCRNEMQAKSFEATLETTAVHTNIGTDAKCTVLSEMDAVCSEAAFDTEIANNLMQAVPAVTVADASTDTDYIQCRAILESMDLKKRVAELEAEVAKLNTRLEEANCLNYGIKTIFTEGQIRRLKYPQAVSHWCWEDISNAIRLHSAGPRAYNHLYKKGFPYPSLTTLKRWTRKVNFDEGVLKFSIESMKHRTNLTFDEKICVLSFDEMKIASMYKHDPSSDTVRAPCNFVQVAMVRGLKSSWKQPIFYSFDCKMTKDILHQILNALHDASYTVVAMVSDMGPSNQKLWTELGVNTSAINVESPKIKRVRRVPSSWARNVLAKTRLEGKAYINRDQQPIRAQVMISEDWHSKTWFENPASPSEKIFVFADVPHLLKLIRNHFLDTGFLFDGKIISVQTIKELMHHTLSSDVSISCKLTEEHIIVNQAGTQKVKLAAQLFSNTTANAIRWLHSNGAEFYNPLETADFFQLVNDWFDVLNSKLSTPFNIPSKQVFGKDFPAQDGILRAMDKIMSKPITPGKASLASFQKGILISNSSIRLLHAYALETNNMEYIATYRLNQDLLEHFFEAIRSKGGMHDHPSPMEFRYRLRKYLLGIQDTKATLLIT